MGYKHNINLSNLYSKKLAILFSKFGIRATALALGFLCTACSSPTRYEYERMLTNYKYSSKSVNDCCSNTEEYELELNSPFSRSDLVNAVLSVNPSLESARQTWRGMLAKYPQVISWDDPTASFMFAPGTITSKTVLFGQETALSQKFPFPGKLSTRGRIALAEAGSSEEDYEWVKIQLATAASNLFDDYYLIERAIEINQIHIDLLKDIKESANSQYASGIVNAQVPLQADVELAKLEYEQLSLATDREVIIAKINTLLHRDPSFPLPASPKNFTSIGVSETVGQLQDEALQNRPDLRAIRAQIGAAASTIDLAYLEYFPDFEVKGSYNTMWPVPSMFTSVGVGFNIPIQLERRRGAVDEARANIKRLSSKHDELVDQTLADVSTILKRVSLAREYIEILQDKIIPTAKDELEVAIVGFEAGQNSFLVLIESERTLRTLELQLPTALAELYRQLALLDQAVGYILHFSEGDQCHE
jgi:outer membrane protein TolC